MPGIEKKIPSRRAVAVILAGGASSRMGIDKAAIRIEGKTLLERAEKELSDSFEKVVVSISSDSRERYGPENEKRLLIDDLLPGHGPLGGIYSVMHSVESELYFITACDMPFLNGRIAAEMVAAAGDMYDVVVPRMRDGYLHPLHAVYRRTCLPHIACQINGDQNKIIDFFGDVRTLFIEEETLRRCDPELRCLQNINTREDLENIATIEIQSA